MPSEITIMTNTTTNGTANGSSTEQMSKPNSAATNLRRMVETDGIVVAPGVYDGFGARIAHEVGFDVIYMVSIVFATLLQHKITP